MASCDAAINGWICIDKDYGRSSASVVNEVKKLIGKKCKVGHAGTLDPLATGVLPVAIGSATKLVSYAMQGRKVYVFTCQWGKETSTHDIEGEVVHSSFLCPNSCDINDSLSKFVGEISQKPPRTSAVKIRGERAYKKMRRGDDFTIPPRTVTIYNLEVICHSDKNNSTEFRMECGAGVYVRALARDMGRMLGCYGYISDLRRVKSGCFEIDRAISLETLSSFWHNNEGYTGMLPVHCCADSFMRIDLDSGSERLLYGEAIRVDMLGQKDIDLSDVWAFFRGEIVAIGKVSEGYFHPRRLLSSSL